MRRTLAVVAGLVAALLSASPVAAVTNGVPDAGEHPYVGELLFYVPDAVDPRFDDPGGWFTCTGTLVDATHVITAGHCTFAVGANGVSTTNGGQATTAAEGGTGGNDVWIDFAEAPDFDILPPSATFAPADNAGRYAAWSSALDASPEWHRATAEPHPLYDDSDATFFVHDLGVLELDDSVTMGEYGQIAPLDWLDRYAQARRNAHRFEAVGYGLEKVLPILELGGDTRRKSEPKLNSINGNPRDTYIVLSNNARTGGTCFGDSGGPTFDNSSSNLVVAVTSFGTSPNCTGTGGAYRIDQPDDLAFLATFGIEP
jgi:hypothetical protein